MLEQVRFRLQVRSDTKQKRRFRDGIPLDDRVLLLQVPRLVDRISGNVQPLKSFQVLKDGVDLRQAFDSEEIKTQLFQAFVFHDYDESASVFLKILGLHKAPLRHLYLDCCARFFDEFNMLPIASRKFIGLWMDGGYLASQNICLCMGVTPDYQKVPISCVRVSKDARNSLLGLNMELSERGFTLSRNSFVIVDGPSWLHEGI